MMSYDTRWKRATAEVKSAKTARTEAVSARPLVPPISTRSSRPNCPAVWKRSTRSVQRSTNASKRAKMAEGGTFQGFSGDTVSERTAASPYAVRSAAQTRSATRSLSADSTGSDSKSVAESHALQLCAMTSLHTSRIRTTSRMGVL